MAYTTVPSSSATIIAFNPPPQRPDTFVRLSHALLQSPAWQSLRALSRAVYVDIASRYNGHNNGRISYSVRDGMKEFNVSHHTIRRALKEIQTAGLLICTKHGYGNPVTKQSVPSEWHLPEYGEAVATRGQCLPIHPGSSGHHSHRAVATTATKYIDKEVDNNKVTKTQDSGNPR
jgi:hypothetical protein